MAGSRPQEWRVFSLPQVLDFQEGPGILAVDFRESGVPLVRLAGLSASSLLSGCNFLDPGQVEEKWSHFSLRRGDTLLSTSASLGRVARVGPEAVGAIPYTGIVRFRPSGSEVCEDFVPLLLTSPDFARQIESMGAGSVMRHFGPSHLRQMSVIVPPVEDQQAIVSVMAALDDKIESNRRLVLVQRNARRMAFRRVASHTIARSPLGRLVRRTGKTIQPAANPDQPFQQFSIPAFDAGEDPEQCLGSHMKSGKTRLPNDEVLLLSKLNPATWRVWRPVRESGGIAVCSPEFVAIVAHDASMFSWLESAVRFDAVFRDEVLAAVSGSTGSRQRVKPSDVLAATIPLPDDGAVEAWNSFAGPMLERESTLVRESRTLTAIRDALLPKLISGQIRVPLLERSEKSVGVPSNVSVSQP